MDSAYKIRGTSGVLPAFGGKSQAVVGSALQQAGNSLLLSINAPNREQLSTSCYSRTSALN